MVGGTCGMHAAAVCYCLAGARRRTRIWQYHMQRRSSMPTCSARACQVRHACMQGGRDVHANPARRRRPLMQLTVDGARMYLVVSNDVGP